MTSKHPHKETKSDKLVKGLDDDPKTVDAPPGFSYMVSDDRWHHPDGRGWAPGEPWPAEAAKQDASAPSAGPATAQPSSAAAAASAGTGSVGDAKSDPMRREYRVLTDAEKTQMDTVKQEGQRFYDYLTTIGDSVELTTAKVKIEEAVMWATKYITRPL